MFTTAQRDAFYTFYDTTTKGGSIPFIWNNPAHSVPGLYIFDAGNPPQVDAVGFETWRVGISVFRLGDA